MVDQKTPQSSTTESHASEIEGIAVESIKTMLTTARDQTWQAIEDIKSLITPGMSEKEAIFEANRLLAQRGVKKFWHRTHIRFGKSTVLSFEDSYRENVTLQEDDI